MPTSNPCVFEVALSWTTMHVGAGDAPTLNRHSKTRMKPDFAGSTVPPIRRYLKLCGSCHGAAQFA